MLAPFTDDALAKRNSWVLFCAQATAGACPPIVFGSGGLAGLYLLGADKSLATVPITFFMLGNMIAAIPASFYMARVGRRVGFITGTAFGIVGGVLAALAVLQGSFWGLTGAMMLLGVQLAFVGYMRYAAADSASSALKPKMISRVLAGGVIAAIVGPSTAIALKDLFDPIPFAGAFLGASALALIGMGCVAFLKTPILPPAPMSAGRPLSEIVRDVRFVAAVACGTVGYVLMNFVMTSAPIAMVGCGLSFAQAQHGIQWHVIAMYAPSFLTGPLIARYGSGPVTATGFLLLLACALVGLTGLTVWHFWIGLVFLGIGWNFAYIGATALIANLHRPEERAKVQAANDFTVFSCVTVGSFVSGKVLSFGETAAAGWTLVNTLVVPLSLFALALLFLAKRREARTA